ncbi:MAG: tetratricopeptide repeat protein [Deltaproteobacteria bacterium]|nr:tetratricopeptide repeat protein [Deltaproteobacteria bacterium]
MQRAFAAVTLASQVGSVAVCGVLAGLLAPQSALAGEVDRAINNDINNIRTSVTLVEDDLKRMREKERRYPLDRRYVDATLAYERGNLPTASVLLVDLVGNAEFQLSRDYTDALYMLGDSLYRQRNFGGARRYLEKVLNTPGTKWYQNALAELVDIAVRMHRMDEVGVLAKRLDAVPPGDRKSELFYQFGRSYFAAKDNAKAQSYLEQVSVGDHRWPAARFYLGAVLVAQGKLDDAIAEYKRVADAAVAAQNDPKRKFEATVVDYVNIALGRLLLNKKKYDEAVQYYLAIERNSPIFEEALFELAATYVANNQPKRAIEVLDVLLLTVSDDNVAVQAAVLRGRINMLDKQYDKADAAYKEVVERYSAIEGELRNFAASDKNLEQFFAWLLARGSEDYSVVRPVSERVARYIEKDEDMSRVVSLFDDMSAERADVKESAKLAATLDAALREGARLDMFPDLKDAWVRLNENQNRVVDIGRRIVEALRSQAGPFLAPDDKAKVEVLYAARKALEEAFAKIPHNADAYIKRQNRVANDFASLAGDVGLLKAALANVKEQLLSVEKMLNERVFGGEGVVLSKEQEKKIREGLQAEKDELRRIYRDLEEVAVQVDVQSQTVGAGDKVSGDEAVIRKRLMAAQRAEAEVYLAALQRAASGDTTGLQVARGNAEKLMADIIVDQGTVQDRAAERLVGIRKVLSQEQRNIAEYQVSVRSYEDDSRALARQVGYTLVRAAQNRLSEIILEADLGLVDVAWQRKQEKATAIRGLQDERAGRIKSLGDVMNNLSGDGSEEE